VATTQEVVITVVPTYDLTVHFPDGESRLSLIAFSEGHAFTLARQLFAHRPITIRKRMPAAQDRVEQGR